MMMTKHGKYMMARNMVGEGMEMQRKKNVRVMIEIEGNFETEQDSVEKRKISYFVLALNFFQQLISPNQDDLSYSARTFISGLQNG